MYKLSDIEKKAVVLGKLNYQVENGGFYQWVDNGYVSSIEYLLLVLKEMDTETSKKVAELLENIRPFVISGVKNTGCFGKYLTLDHEDVMDNIEFNYLDDEYYNINEKFMEDCEEFLIKLAQK